MAETKSIALVSARAAQGLDDRIIYNPVNGNLMFDPDGSGAATATTFATLQTNLSLSAGDFHIV